MKLAFDRATIRRKDVDGRLHVELNPISKANICPYLGSEIPNAETLGLDPQKVYRLLRHPEELGAAAATFNNIPLLKRHVAVTADEPHADLVVGSTGTDAVFEAPYLKNTIVVWDAEAIAGIETDVQKELSSAYRYEADMTPGEYEGLPFDGIMRNLVGNHVALVEIGRAGSDVVVGDSIAEIQIMAKALRSRQALLTAGALAVYLRPKLAQDSKIDLNSILGGVTAKNFADKKSEIAEAVKTATRGKLAQDADLGDVVEFLDTLTDAAEEAEEDEEKPAVDSDDGMAKVMEFLKGKLSEEDMNAVAMMAKGETPAMDYDSEEEEKDVVTKPAMDAALARATKDAIARVNAIHEAKEEVAPIVGKLALSFDSAEAVYKVVLDHAGVDVKGVHPSAYRALVKLIPGRQKATPAVAMDSGDAAKRFAAKYPNAKPLVRS